MIVQAAEQGDTFATVITPFLPVIGTIVGAIIVGSFALWNRRKGAVETRAPDVNEIWQQQHYQSHELDKETRFRRRLETWSHDMWLTFREYVDRVLIGGDPHLTFKEQKFYDGEPPTRTTEVPIQK